MQGPIAYVCFGVLSPTRAHNVQVRRNVEALAALGEDVLFVNPLWSEEWSESSRPTLNVPATRRLLLRRSRFYDLGRRISHRGRFWWLLLDRAFYSARVSFALSQARPRAIVTRDIVAAAWLTALRRLHCAPVLYECHNLEQITFAAAPHGNRARGGDFAPHQHDGSWAGWAYLATIARLESWTLRNCDAVVTVTAALADTLRCEHGVKRVVVMPNGHIVGRPLYPRDEYRARLGLPREKRIALYCGLSFEGKGVEKLVEIARYVPDDIAIVILGGTPAEHVALQSRVDVALQSRLIVRPRVLPELVSEYLHAADIGLLVYPETPSLGICSCPLKLVEYLAAGLPTLATGSAATREVLRDGSNGVIVETREPVLVAEALTTLLRDERRLEEMRGHALADAQRRTQELRAQRLVELIGSLDLGDGELGVSRN